MGSRWDGTGIETDATFWAEVLRVMKPGAFLICMGGTRTFHRIAVAVEDAGFNLRDTIGLMAWAYGTGFPKSRDIAKDLARIAPDSDLAAVYHGRGTALSPSWEPLLLFKKPLDKGLSIAANCARWGTGALDIDGARHGAPEHVPSPTRGFQCLMTTSRREGGRTSNSYADQPAPPWERHPDGYYPNNQLLVHHPRCRLVAAGTKCRTTVRKTANGAAAASVQHSREKAQFGYAGDGPHWKCHPDCVIPRTYGRYAAQFAQFASDLHSDTVPVVFCPKPGLAEKEAGCAALDPTLTPRTNPGGMADDPKWEAKPRTNTHPTVKPVSLMRYLIRLVKPPTLPGRTPPVGLDPFCGSGTTLVAAIHEGVAMIGCEAEERYLPIAAARIAQAHADDAAGRIPALFTVPDRKPRLKKPTGKKVKARYEPGQLLFPIPGGLR